MVSAASSIPLPSRRIVGTGLGSGSRVRPSRSGNTVSTSLPMASSALHPVKSSATRFMNVIFRALSVARPASPMLPSVVVSHSSLSLKRRSSSCLCMAVWITALTVASAKGLTIYPSGSAALARCRVESSACAVRKMTGNRKFVRICRAASTPSISPLRRMSMRTRSGRDVGIFLKASAPVDATETTSWPRPARQSSMSSRTRISSSTTRILDLGMRRFPCDRGCFVRRCVLPSESNLDRSPTRGLTLDDAAELLDQGSDQAPAQGARAAEIHVCGYTDSIVPDDEAELFLSLGVEADVNGAGVTEGEGVLQAVRHQLVEDQAARHGTVQAQRQVVDVGPPPRRAGAGRSRSGARRSTAAGRAVCG